MFTIRITIDESLLAEVDRAVQQLGTTRSAFICDSLRLALKKHKTLFLERKHRDGYTKKPVEPDEFNF